MRLKEVLDAISSGVISLEDEEQIRAAFKRRRQRAIEIIEGQMPEFREWTNGMGQPGLLSEPYRKIAWAAYALVQDAGSMDLGELHEVIEEHYAGVRYARDTVLGLLDKHMLQYDLSTGAVSVGSVPFEPRRS